MEVKPKKTIRFDAQVKQSGTPVQVTLWTKPDDDPDFMRAVKEDRVATVIQHNVGTKKDYGLVGFYPQERATYLIFPEPLPHPNETKIVGLKYDKLATPRPKGAIYKPPAPKPPGIPLREKVTPRHAAQPKSTSRKNIQPAPKQPKPKPPEIKKPTPPKLFTFRSIVDLKATQSATLEVEAPSAKEAAKLLQARARELTIDPQAKISRTIHKPQKLL